MRDVPTDVNPGGTVGPEAELNIATFCCSPPVQVGMIINWHLIILYC